jgi:hypothetical protein
MNKWSAVECDKNNIVLFRENGDMAFHLWIFYYVSEEAVFQMA